MLNTCDITLNLSPTSIEQFLTAESADTIKKEIIAVDGNEVLFLGNADSNGLVSGIKVIARGNGSCAPAILGTVHAGAVLIHNHPSGKLLPSDADVGIASIVGEMGAGFYIVNNDVDALYALVAPHREKNLKNLDDEEVLAYFEAHSSLAGSLEAYDERREQQEMAKSVTDAFNNNKIHLVEAGTGVGKSMAYLIPSVMWALANGERVVISTNTINLQEQLISRDIPLLQRHVFGELKATLVKGRGNYACLRKAYSLKTEGGYLFEECDENEEKALQDWINKTQDGSRSDLDFIPKASCWEKLASEADMCLRAKCEYFNECFFYKARRKAASSDLLVANHHLLFADLAIRCNADKYSEAAVMPPYHRLIIDEAHNIEDIATQYFGARITKRGLLLLLGRLYGKKNNKKGLLPFLNAKIHTLNSKIPEKSLADATAMIQEHLVPALITMRELASEFFDYLTCIFLESADNEAGAKDADNVRRIGLNDEICKSEGWGELESRVIALLSIAGSLTGKLYDLTKIVSEFQKNGRKNLLETQITELRAYSDRLSSLTDVLKTFFFNKAEGFVKWLEISEGAKETTAALQLSPLSIAGEMKKNVYDVFKTVILTSATLSVRGRFDFIKERLGLGLIEDRYGDTLLESPFDYKKQAFVGIPENMPAPGEKDYVEILAERVSDAIKISKGRAFVLFTSYNMMNDVYDCIGKMDIPLNFRVMKQGDEPRYKLLRKFRSAESSVLFGSDSFWEGVDVVGHSLVNVVITKLPFNVPGHPVTEARMKMMKKSGGNPFIDYIIPQAVIKFKQGFGRLIRNRTDRGAVLVLDSRVVRKKYGNYFLNSLPPSDIFTSTGEDVIKEMRIFFERNGI